MSVGGPLYRHLQKPGAVDNIMALFVFGKNGLYLEFLGMC